MLYLFLLPPYLWVLPDAKASSEILYTSVYSVVCRDTFWWYLTGDLWNWLGSDHPITRVDHNGGERLCSTAANVDHAIGFVSIVGAFTKMKESEKIKKNQLYCVGYFVGHDSNRCTDRNRDGYVVLVLDGASFTEGAAETARIAELAERSTQVQDLSIPQQIVSFIPNNVFADLAGTRSTSTIGVVIFSAFVGIAYLGVKKKAPKEAQTFADLMDSLYKIVMRIVTLVLRLTPYGVLALMTNVLASSDFEAILNLGKFILASYAALIIVLLVHSLLLASVKVNQLLISRKLFQC